jgi:hypothetical protein
MLTPHVIHICNTPTGSDWSAGTFIGPGESAFPG